jgi:DNA polymerase-1
MLVGEAPGEKEDEMGKPFQGRAGKMLDSFLRAFEIERSSIFISNAVKCRPPDNGTPDWKQIQACRKYLLMEIERVKPRLILALGGIAAKSVLNRRACTVTDMRNIVHKMPDTGIPVMVTYHPAGVLRNNYYMEPTVEDFERALAFVKGEEIDVKTEVKSRYVYLDSVDQLPKIKSRIAIDTETNSLRPELQGTSIKFIQVCQQEGFAYMLPWNEETANWFQKIAEDEKITKVFHNAKFDMKWFKKYRITMKGPIFCTLIAAHLLDENAPDKSLDVLATQLTPVKHHKNKMKAWLKEDRTRLLVDAPKDILAEYGCGDADATFRLSIIFEAKLKEDKNSYSKANLWTLFQMQMECLRGPALEMEIRGFQIDIKLLPKLRKLYKGKIAEDQEILETKVAKTSASYGSVLNVGSWQQVKGVIYDQWDLPAMGRDKKKKWGAPPIKDTSEATIMKLIHYVQTNDDVAYRVSKRVALEKILEIRGNRKLLSTYIEGIDKLLDSKGRIHSNFRLDGTVTGRWSSREPNNQNIPRAGEIKKMFISRFGDDGCIFKMDLSQAELRWAAWHYREHTMLKDLDSGRDIHKVTAARVFETKFDKVDENQRKKAKIVNFGILYRSGADTMAQAMGCSSEEAQDFIDRWQEHYKRFEIAFNMLKGQIIKYGMVRYWSGRIRRTPVLQPYGREFNAAMREAFNSPIQGGVSDFLVLGMNVLYNEIRSRGIKAYFVANVHDEIVLDTLKIHAEELSELCVDIFTRRKLVRDYANLPFDVKMEIETAAGPNWLEVETIHGDKNVVKAKV